jgi:transcription antitermination factor NusG
MPSQVEIAGGTNWYAVYTRHQHEKAVAYGLESKGFEVVLPLCKEARRWQDRVKLLSLPLFPCYVFVKTRLDRRSDIVTIPGIHGFVQSGGLPSRVTTSDIEAIRRTMETGNSLKPHRFLKTGTKVRIRSGSLEGIEGILVRSKGDFRLVLSIQMLGKAAAMEVDVSQVEPVKRTSYGFCEEPHSSNSLRQGISNQAAYYPLG